MTSSRMSWAWVPVLVVLGCGRSSEKEPATFAGKADTATAAQGSTAFALDLYGRLRSGRENLFLSPLSISTALSMTYAGARGETAREMASVLRLPEDQDAAHEQVGEILQQLEAVGKAKGCRLDVANALWGQQDASFLPEFLSLIKDKYGGGMERVDFSKAEEARRTINAWVEKKTEGKIKDLIPPGMLRIETGLVLTNAVYFKADWAMPFDKKRTTDAPFIMPGDRKVNVPMMRRTAELRYMESKDLQALELPYAGDTLSMVILLPGKADGLNALENSLTPGDLDGWLKSLDERLVDVWLPRFTTTMWFELSEVLKEMGMPSAFSLGSADFSGMTGARGLFIGNVVHKAFVDVNEEGTEAAAATAVHMPTAAPPGPSPRPVVFKADHPFFFLIRDVKTGSILFMGRVVNPKE